MNKPLCDTECELEDLENKNICCYWCIKNRSCHNPCRNLDCKAVKEMKFDGE